MAKQSSKQPASVPANVVPLAGSATMSMAVKEQAKAELPKRRFSVALKYHETLVVEAVDEADALKVYYAANGIIQSDHQANIQEVVDERRDDAGDDQNADPGAAGGTDG